MNDNKRQDPKPKQVSHEGGTSGLIEVQVLPLSKLVGNTGQIEGLPKNPRLLKDDRFRKLVKSIEDDPEMLDLRELIVVPKDGIYVVIAGNMRLRAMQELKMKEAPCKVLPADTTIEKLKAYTIKDNVPFGEHDWSALANEWDADELSDWGLDLPAFASEPDYSILADEDEELQGQLDDMRNGVKKAIQIEFEAEHYDEAYLLVKHFRDAGGYVGGMIMEFLKAEKAKG